jgi:lipopolysaccharide export system permease protein
MTLDSYFAQCFLRCFGRTLVAFFLILGLIDLIEHIRRFGDEVDRPGLIIALVLLNVPSELYAILPFVLTIASITLFLGLARSSELVVVRSAGRSALRALLGPGLMAGLIGVLGAGAINPLAARAAAEYDSRVAAIRGEQQVLSISEEGFWLRQGGEEGPTVIHAARSNTEGTELTRVTFLRFASDGRPLERIEADRARLKEGAWRIEVARVWALDHPNPEASATTRQTLTLPSSLTSDQIRDGFGDPSAIPIWQLPQFIAQLEEAGFTAERHRVYFQTELAQPAFFVAMLLIAAGFTLRPQRAGGTGLYVLGAILMGFSAYILRDLTLVLGEAGQVSPVLAVWAPTLAVIGLSLTLLLHLEEG